MVAVPSVEDEDHRRICRERRSLVVESIRHINRVKGLLFAQGAGDYEPLRANRRAQLEEDLRGFLSALEIAGISRNEVHFVDLGREGEPDLRALPGLG